MDHRAVTAVKDAPLLTAVNLTISEGQTLTLLTGDVAITDPDSASFPDTVRGVTGGYFQLSNAVGRPITRFTTTDLSGGSVQCVDNGDEIAPAFNVTADDGAWGFNTMTATINYTPVNDAPFISQLISTPIDDIDSVNLDGGMMPVAFSRGVGLTAGMLWWLTRSGGLLTSITMGLPAWRHLDPLAGLFDDAADATGHRSAS